MKKSRLRAESSGIGAAVRRAPDRPDTDDLLAQAEAQRLRFEAAIENMSQGLCFFDGAQRLIVSNRRYAELYDLPPDRVRPGVTLREIIDLRFAAGS